MKIFWSWQANTPGNIGRYLVRDALNDAIEKLKQDEAVEDLPAISTSIIDIKNVTGSPDLVRTILEKIEKSELVVADVTIVGKAAPRTSSGVLCVSHQSSPQRILKGLLPADYAWARWCCSLSA